MHRTEHRTQGTIIKSSSHRLDDSLNWNTVITKLFFFRLRSETDRSFLFTLIYVLGRVFTPEGRPSSSHNWARRKGSRFYLPRIDFQAFYCIQHEYHFTSTNNYSQSWIWVLNNAVIILYPFYLLLKHLSRRRNFSLDIVDVFTTENRKPQTYASSCLLGKRYLPSSEMYWYIKPKKPWISARSCEQTVIPPKNAVEPDRPKSYGVKNNDAYTTLHYKGVANKILDKNSVSLSSVQLMTLLTTTILGPIQ